MMEDHQGGKDRYTQRRGTPFFVLTPSDINECLATPPPCGEKVINCKNLVNDFRCFCKPGHTGRRCEQDRQALKYFNKLTLSTFVCCLSFLAHYVSSFCSLQMWMSVKVPRANMVVLATTRTISSPANVPLNMTAPSVRNVSRKVISKECCGINSSKSCVTHKHI